MWTLLISLAFLAFIGYHVIVTAHVESLLREQRARLGAIHEIIVSQGLRDEDRLTAIDTMVSVDIDTLLQNKNQNFFGKGI